MAHMLIYLLVSLDLESKIFKFKDIVSMVDGALGQEIRAHAKPLFGSSDRSNLGSFWVLHTNLLIFIHV
jgi:hypothetical protein